MMVHSCGDLGLISFQCRRQAPGVLQPLSEVNGVESLPAWGAGYHDIRENLDI